MRILSSDERIAPESRVATKRFLTEFTPADYDNARRLWDEHSGAKGLLDKHVGNRGGFVYDPAKERYIRLRSGREVTDKELALYVRRVSNSARDQMKKETQQFIAGTIIFAVWYSRMRSLMKSLYYTVWLTSIGGFLFDDATQRALFYAFILSQFNWLDNFVLQVNTGKQALDGIAVTRAGLYGAYGNGAYQNVLLSSRQQRGWREGRRLLGENENHCHDSKERPGCIELALLGWTPIERITPIGEATCYSNCLCRFEFRR